MSDRSKPPALFPAAHAENAASARPCVLMVEDDLSARWLMRNALKGVCDFLSAGSGEEALALYARHQPQVVVLDFGLPHKKGDDVLRLLLEADPDACVIVMSGSENIAAMQAMVAAGARGMLVKPFEKADLLRAVQQARQMDDTLFFSK